MKRPKRIVFSVMSAAVLISGALAADPAFARRGWQDNDPGAHHQEPWRDNRGWDNRGRVVVREDTWHGNYRFRDDERVVVRNYYRGYRPVRHVRYVVGRPLPTNVVYEEPPAVVVERLRPPPPQYRYVQVDGNILLLNDLTHVIADAIELN